MLITELKLDIIISEKQQARKPTSLSWKRKSFHLNKMWELLKEKTFFKLVFALNGIEIISKFVGFAIKPLNL